MARVTVENCVDKVQDRFELVIVASQRAKELYNGTPSFVAKDDDKNTVIALREIEENKLDIQGIRDGVIRGYRHNVSFNDTEDANKELEFIEKEIMNEVVFEDVNQELNNVSEDELNNIVA